MEVDITNVFLAFVGFVVLRKLLNTVQVTDDFSRVLPQMMDHTMAQGINVTSDGPYVKGR
jgi:hypothetical protein